MLYSMPIASQPGARYPSFVNISQSVLEHDLYSALRAMPGCQVFWQHKVTGITQDGDGVNVEVQTPSDMKYLRASYVLVATARRVQCVIARDQYSGNIQRLPCINAGCANARSRASKRTLFLV